MDNYIKREKAILSKKRNLSTRFTLGTVLFVLFSLFSCTISVNLVGELDEATEGNFPLSSAPTNLVVDSVSSGDVVTLTWDAYPESFDGYKLYLGSSTDVTTSDTLVTTSTANSYSFTASSGTVYYYAVLAYKGNSESPLSDVLEYSIYCGNGFIETGETCDDGNQSYGDGCSPICIIEVADTTAPVLTSIAVSGTATGAGGTYAPGDKVSVSWTVTDDISGYFGADLYLMQDGGGGQIAQVEGLGTGNFSYTFTVSEVVGGGLYYPAIVLYDYAGNASAYFYHSINDPTFLTWAIYNSGTLGALNISTVLPASVNVEPMTWPPASAVLILPDGSLTQSSLSALGDVQWYKMNVSAGNNYLYYILDSSNSSWAGGGMSLSVYQTSGTALFESEFGWNMPVSVVAPLNEVVYLQVRAIDAVGSFGVGAWEKLPGGVCGDGVLNFSESCDDGNVLSGDGCTATCEKEPLSALATDITNVNAGAGQKANITLQTHPFVQSNIVIWYHPLMNKYVVKSGIQSAPGVWDFQFPGGPYVENGNWYISTITIDDFLDTHFEYQYNLPSYDLFYNGTGPSPTAYNAISLNITGSTPDTTLPKLLSTTVPAGIYYYDNRVIIDMDASDSGAGIELGYVEMRDENGVFYGSAPAWHTGGNTYSADLRLQGAAFTNRAIYPQIYLYERAGNNVYYYYNPVNTGVYSYDTMFIPSGEVVSSVSANSVTMGTTAVSANLTVGGPYTQYNMTNYGEGHIFTFNAVSGITYTVFWDDTFDGSGGTTANVQVSTYNADYTPAGVGALEKDAGFTFPYLFTSTTTGLIYLEVRSTNGGGTYKIRVQ